MYSIKNVRKIQQKHGFLSGGRYSSPNKLDLSQKKLGKAVTRTDEGKLYFNKTPVTSSKKKKKALPSLTVESGLVRCLFKRSPVSSPVQSPEQVKNDVQRERITSSLDEDTEIIEIDDYPTVATTVDPVYVEEGFTRMTGSFKSPGRYSDSPRGRYMLYNYTVNQYLKEKEKKKRLPNKKKRSPVKKARKFGQAVVKQPSK
ncbi:hypothetical protein PCE1_003486 [Barthelona sp. PCE]